MIGNPRYGVVGLGSLPHIAFCEGLGPLIEGAGYLITLVAAVLGFLDWTSFGLMLTVSVLFGAASTLLAVLPNDLTTRQYTRGLELALLVVLAAVESLGYRQVNALWGWIGTVQALTGKSEWGPMRRQAFRT